LQTADGVQFVTDADSEVFGGVVTIPITAMQFGSSGNVVSGTIISMTSSIAGIDSEATIDSTDGGVDQESLDSLRARLESRLTTPPHGGTKKDYEDWAKSVAGVSNAYCFPLYDYDNNVSDQPGYVSVAIIEDNEPASGALVDQVQEYFDVVAPITAIVTAFAPDAQTINFSIAITPSSGYNQSAVEASVEAVLRDLFFREAAPGATLPLSHIREAISRADGEFDFTMSTPSADIVSTKKQLPVVGTFTFS
jgi:uncharacterized phage protein gp47/JayE